MSFRSTCPTCSMVSVFPDTHRNTPHTCKRCGEFRFLQEDVALLGPAPAPPRVPAAPQPVVLVAAAPAPAWPQPRPRGFLCPYCGAQSPPIVRQQISTAGWVLFVVLLLVCFPLCIVALFVKEDYRVCSGCGIKLG